ncbi:gamma carbonic anhydrase family protein [Kineobactrum sediminis]|uniref:Gamma carbonic anhydrase family protein n=1 Tax=Kineobactrum sediminis TaxID=1905677 RepID=A0A2N5Y7M1_9GAMM|nr:gamma carbonic anhydrase family protein [Kineobactrum sediminis]PLW84392.1 gamma carbonic anhydrase family protein [Kineobactrum sediminis]
MPRYTAGSVRSFGGHLPQIGKQVLIDPSAVVLGDVVLGDDVSVWPQAVIRGDMHSIRLGARTSVQDGCVLHITHAGPYNTEGWPLLIGSEVTIGHKAILHGCTIGNRVLVGMAATVMDGVVVEDEVVIGAGALVTPGKTLRSGYLYAGSPAREVRPLTEAERNYFSYSADNYVRLKDRHLAELDQEPVGLTS